MRGSRRSFPTFVTGLLAIAGMALGCYVAFGGRGPFAGGYEIHAVVRGAPELHSRTPVRIAGVDVGRVRRVERGRGETARLTMVLQDKGLPVHRDAALKLRPRTFLEGNFFVDLQPGTPSAPPIEEGETIPLASTAVPVLLQDVGSPLVLLAPVGADLKAHTRQALKDGVESLRRTLDEGGAEAVRDLLEPAGPALLSAAQVAEAARGEREGDLGGAVDSTGRVLAAVPESRLPELVTGLSRTVGALASHDRELERSLPELDALLREAYPALADIAAMLPAARSFAAEAQPGVEALAPGLRPAPAFLDQAGALLRPAELPRLLEKADPAVVQLARLQRPLARALGLVSPVTECLRRNAVPTLKTPIEDPPHSTGQPVYRDLLYALVGQTSGSQNFDGNGPALRYHAGLGTRSVGIPLPGGETIVGLTPEEILGSRPRYTAKLPPLRPDVRCATQTRPDLRAETGPPPPQGGASAAGVRQGRDRLGRVLRRRAR